MIKSRKILSLMFIATGFVFAAATTEQVHAQTRDPFSKPGWATPKTANPNPSPSGKVEKVKVTPPAPMPVGIPPIQDRIDYYKRLREMAVTNNQPVPKVTEVLTLDEMSISGIFRTPRGFAAMVQAKPINLSYTIYPGEKFFNGQLVAIEENRLVFRKVVKMNNGKFIASEENKSLRQYSVQEEVQGTAPVENTAKSETTAPQAVPAQQAAQTPADPTAKPVSPALIISPLDEMNKQVQKETPKSAKEKETDKKGKAKSPAKKPVKVAANKEN